MKGVIFVALAFIFTNVYAQSPPLPNNLHIEGTDITINGISTIYFLLPAPGSTGYVQASNLTFSGLPSWASRDGNNIVAYPPPNDHQTIPICVKYSEAGSAYSYQSISLVTSTKPTGVSHSIAVANSTPLPRSPVLMNKLVHQRRNGNGWSTLTKQLTGDQEEEESGGTGAIDPIPGDQLATILPAPNKFPLVKGILMNLLRNGQETCSESTFLQPATMTSSNLCTETEDRLESAKKQFSIYEDQVSSHTKISDGIEEKIKALNLEKQQLIDELNSLGTQQGNLQKTDVIVPTKDSNRLEELRLKLKADQQTLKALNSGRSKAFAVLSEMQNEEQTLSATFKSIQGPLSIAQAKIVEAQEEASYYELQQISINADIADNKNLLSQAPVGPELDAAKQQEKLLLELNNNITAKLENATETIASNQQSVLTIQNSLTDLQNKYDQVTYNIAIQHAIANENNTQLQQLSTELFDTNQEFIALKKVVEEDRENYIGFVIVRPSEKEDALLEEVRKLAKEIDSQHAILTEELQQLAFSQISLQSTERIIKADKKKLLSCTKAPEVDRKP